jgi:hypothetical protein
MATNAQYNGELEEKLQSLFLNAHPRINKLLDECLGLEPTFPKNRAFESVWCISTSALEKLLPPYAQKSLDETLEIIVDGRTLEHSSELKTTTEKLKELARFDSFLGEELVCERKELLKQMKRNGDDKDTLRRLERYFHEVDLPPDFRT